MMVGLGGVGGYWGYLMSTNTPGNTTLSFEETIIGLWAFGISIVFSMGSFFIRALYSTSLESSGVEAKLEGWKWTVNIYRWLRAIPGKGMIWKSEISVTEET